MNFFETLTLCKTKANIVQCVHLFIRIVKANNRWNFDSIV